MKIVSGQVTSSQLPQGLETFSFHTTPVLVIENFWSAEERVSSGAPWSERTGINFRTDLCPGRTFRTPAIGPKRRSPSLRGDYCSSRLGDALYSAVYRIVPEHLRRHFGIQLLLLQGR